MKVLKFGGASLKDADSLKLIAQIIKREKKDQVVVLSALGGVTNKLESFLRYPARQNEKEIRLLLEQLKKQHYSVLKKACPTRYSVRSETAMALKRIFNKLERLLYGVSYTEDLTPKISDLIISFGERLSVWLLAEVLVAAGQKARVLEADKIGLVTDGDFGNATVLLEQAAPKVQRVIRPLLRRKITPVVTGFFGCDESGQTTTFGRGGSDYSAAVLAHVLNAKELVIWKSIDGFMTADPEIVPKAHLIDILSYDEAAELAYFGAKILHPQTVEPVMLKNIPVAIRNTFRSLRQAQGKLSNGVTRILPKGYEKKGIIKGVSYDRDLGVVKILGPGVGYKPGVLREAVSHITPLGINIKSVITSQTSINILLAQRDVTVAARVLKQARMKVVDKIETKKDIALVGVVGEGLIRTKGLAARVFAAVARVGVNVEMISAGASTVAYYFIVQEKDLKKSVRAIHDAFF